MGAMARDVGSNFNSTDSILNADLADGICYAPLIITRLYYAMYFNMPMKVALKAKEREDLIFYDCLRFINDNPTELLKLHGAWSATTKNLFLQWFSSFEADIASIIGVTMTILHFFNSVLSVKMEQCVLCDLFRKVLQVEKIYTCYTR